MFKVHARLVLAQRNEYRLLNASLVQQPLDYLASLFNIAGILIQYSECKVNAEKSSCTTLTGNLPRA